MRNGFIRVPSRSFAVQSLFEMELTEENRGNGEEGIIIFFNHGEHGEHRVICLTSVLTPCSPSVVK